MKLNCITAKKPEISPVENIKKQEPKITKKVPKTVEKKKIKRELLKEIPLKRLSVEVVLEEPAEPKELEPKKEMANKETKAEIIVKPSIEKEEKEISQNSVEISLQQESTKTDEEVYVEDNLNLIIELLQENLYYPRRARKRGIEGDVLVRFNLSVNAELSNVEIITSTSDILSRGALKTIENIAPQLPKPKTNLTLSVPIAYRLN